MGEVYREHFAFVWGLIRRLGVHDRDLEDVTQDVFIVVHRRLPHFEGRASIRTWLYAIAVRVAANYRRKRQRAPQASDSMTRRLVAPESANPELHTLRTEAAELLDRLLSKLDDKKRAVFVLAEIEGLSAPEIARIVGTNPRTVHSRLRAARLRVHADLARVQSQHAGEAATVRWVQHAAQPSTPPAGAQKRVWAALLIQLPALSTGTTVGAMGWIAASKAIAVSAGLGVIVLGGVYLGATPTRDASAPSDRVAKDDPQPPRSASGPNSGKPNRPITTARHDDVVNATADAVDLDRSPTGPSSVSGTDTRPRRRADASPTTARPPPSANPNAGDAESADQDPLVAELTLIHQTRRALAAGDAADALRWAQAHARRFPDGDFRVERDRSRVAALCTLGRNAEATALATTSGVPAGC